MDDTFPFTSICLPDTVADTETALQVRFSGWEATQLAEAAPSTAVSDNLSSPSGCSDPPQHCSTRHHCRKTWQLSSLRLVCPTLKGFQPWTFEP